jgi:3-hydroxybutyryl-CoA dehydrogenase
VKSDKIRSAVVIGVGTMGPGIAQCFAQAGIMVKLYARTKESCDKGLADIRRNLEVFAANSLLLPKEVSTVLGRITSTTDMTKACAGTDFVVEAAPESLEVKQSLF